MKAMNTNALIQTMKATLEMTCFMPINAPLISGLVDAINRVSRTSEDA
ncbi:hypothetical protein [Vibrio anguillarum]|nr:hypothetical protein [Vibrio anguillarum]